MGWGDVKFCAYICGPQRKTPIDGEEIVTLVMTFHFTCSLKLVFSQKFSSRPTICKRHCHQPQLCKSLCLQSANKCKRTS